MKKFNLTSGSEIGIRVRIQILAQINTDLKHRFLHTKILNHFMSSNVGGLSFISPKKPPSTSIVVGTKNRRGSPPPLLTCVR